MQKTMIAAWLVSAVQYIRWGWKDMEPARGVLNTNLLDRALRVSRESGQRLAFRVMCCSPYAKPYHPAWLAEIGGKIVEADHNGKSPFPIPDMGDPVVLKTHLDFIRRLGARYDGHPDLDHVDLGSEGWWGEWHLSGSKVARMPPQEDLLKWSTRSRGPHSKSAPARRPARASDAFRATPETSRRRRRSPIRRRPRPTSRSRACSRGCRSARTRATTTPRRRCGCAGRTPPRARPSICPSTPVRALGRLFCRRSAASSQWCPACTTRWRGTATGTSGRGGTTGSARLVTARSATEAWR